jgi:hypothetical protein
LHDAAEFLVGFLGSGLVLFGVGLYLEWRYQR